MGSPSKDMDPLGRVEAAHQMARAATTGTGWQRTTARALVLGVLLILAVLLVMWLVQIVTD